MLDLIEGQQYILATRAGVIKLIAEFNGDSGSWRLSERDGQPVFDLDDSGRLKPLRPLGDPASFTIHDLHEWARKA